VLLGVVAVTATALTFGAPLAVVLWWWLA